MVAALKARGVQRMYWVTMREVKPTYYSHWAGLTAAYRTLYLAYPRANQPAPRRHEPSSRAVDHRLGRHQPTSNGITYDAIHLNPVGASLYAGLARATVVSGRTRVAAGTVLTLPVAGVAACRPTRPRCP